ncbi:hypothetical protein AGDE_13033 [Angomonas deanei]|uniref:Uncharacterized protein n=1 Tax=Angomonas deanei TaxID=59799 RepID=A0A7G2C772_9TRYP|nr:hypothetical protein AGDE_13033 [Angomonas deanei]CAD2215670.1 hypothetical protein, conserved [Angomonas deanei]|eukprot:EPY22847.1 hypothetical protein AGDE_13033 [Angomonas deanei]
MVFLLPPPSRGAPGPRGQFGQRAPPPPPGWISPARPVFVLCFGVPPLLCNLRPSCFRLAVPTEEGIFAPTWFG